MRSRASFGMGEEERDARRGGAEVSSRFPSPPNLERQRRKETQTGETGTERHTSRDREAATQKEVQRGKDTETDTERRRPGEKGRGKRCQGDGETARKGGGGMGRAGGGGRQ